MERSTPISSYPIPAAKMPKTNAKQITAKTNVDVVVNVNAGDQNPGGANSADSGSSTPPKIAQKSPDIAKVANFEQNVK